MKKTTNSNSTRKKLLPAFAMLTVSAVALTSATYAWFTMNKEVSVTGMQVHTKVGDNLLIAQDTLGSTSKVSDGNFKTSDVDTMSALLEPVSSTDGLNFWYTDSFNVAGSGDALADSYTQYSEAAEAGENPSNALANTLGGTVTKKSYYDAAFQSNYGIETPISSSNVAYGYVDYVFQLKANNTGGSSQNINVTNITLTSGKADDANSLHAFRAAIFAENITSANPAGGPGTLITILSNEGANTGDSYFTTKSAISTNGAPTTVNNYNANAIIGSVASKTTAYYKVVVRLWLEGEDKNCNNSVFNTITDNWALSMNIKMDGTAATATLTTPTLASKTDLTSASLATGTGATKVIDGQTYTKIASVQIDSTDIYVGGTTLTGASKIYKIGANNHPIDVTNQCTLPNS